jgi:serine/threonine protein kinase
MLSPGVRLGAYEIVSLIGAGGMGEVYRARDLNLHREVAIKLLQSLHVSNPDRLSRFEREARLLASLSHPNIATIHGLERANGTTFLIMELAPGETLAARLARGRVAILDALPIGLQIAAALEAAHEKGVVHRDLKPANVAITADGKVKVLDFGLAKLMSDDSSEAGATTDLSQSPTIARDQTAAGMIVGTAAYMSPEQARGKPIDQRTDIWAFGCVLYELLTGKPAFTGETLTDIVAAVVNSDPDWQALPAQTPPAIRSLLRRTLKKDQAKRLRDVADARIEIEEVLAEPAIDRPKVATGRVASPMAWTLPWAAAAMALAGLVWTVATRETQPSRLPVSKLDLNVPSGVELGTTYSPNVSLSPDGSTLVFTGTLGGLRRMYTRRLDAFESGTIKGGAQPAYVFAERPRRGVHHRIAGAENRLSERWLGVIGHPS